MLVCGWHHDFLDLGYELIISFLKGEMKRRRVANMNGHVHPVPHPPSTQITYPPPHSQTVRIQPRPRPRGRWVHTPRSWDRKEVGVKCVLPAGIVYFTVWLGEMRVLTPLVSFMSVAFILGPSSPVRFTRPNTRFTVSWGAIYELVTGTAYPTLSIYTT